MNDSFFKKNDCPTLPDLYWVRNAIQTRVLSSDTVPGFSIRISVIIYADLHYSL